MTREQIIDALRSLADAHGGVPSARKFHSASGVSRSDLWRVGFARYSDLVESAGLSPNKLQGAFDKSEMLNKLAELVRRTGKFPTISELKAARAQDPELPSYEAYFRLGGRSISRVPKLLLDYCRAEGYSDVVEVLESVPTSRSAIDSRHGDSSPRVSGYVYLVKHGEHFKIGRSNNVSRRRKEVSLLLPQELEHVHIIETDDPEGIERYWHDRFKDRRLRGEWFRLDRNDVAAFKRRKYQ